MKEIWKDVPDTDGKYLISNYGNIKTYEGVPRKLNYINSGYLVCNLYVRGKYRSIIVSRVVAELFVPNPDPEIFVYVKHVDGDIHNNHYTNLVWTDTKKKQKTYLTKRCRTRIDTFENGEIICRMEYPSIREAARSLGVAISTLNNYCRHNKLILGKYKATKLGS